MKILLKKGDRDPYPIHIIQFKIMNGARAGEILKKKCPLRSRTIFPKQLIPGDPTPFRLGKKIAEDFYEIYQTGLC